MQSQRHRKVAMSTTALAPAIDIKAMQRIEEHPNVQPLALQGHALDERERTITTAIAEASAILRQHQREDYGSTVSVREARLTRQRLEALQDELETVQAARLALAQPLEAAISQARSEIRPALQRLAVDLLKDAEQAVEAWLRVDGALQDLRTRAQRLGVS